MRKIWIIGCLGLLLFSCSKDLGNYHPEVFEFNVLEDKEIELTSTLIGDSTLSYAYEIVDGYSRVFEVNYAGEQFDNIFDDEYGEHLVFQVPTNLDTFHLDGEELIAAKCLFNKWGAWTSSYIYQISEGEISGQRINDHAWSVYVRVYTHPLLNEEKHLVSFEGIFTETP